MVLPTELSASPLYRVSTRSGAVKYLTRCPACAAAWPTAINVWDLPVPAGPIRARFSFALIHSSDVR